jgi:hypothetical protein
VTSCNTGSGGGTPTTQYQAPVFSENGLSTIVGQITIDTTGNTTVKLTNSTASANLTVQFCPAVDASSTKTAIPCFNITTIATDSSGSGTVSLKFPQPGNWAGDFYINDSSGKSVAQTYLSATLSNQTYMSTLLPETTTNSGVVTTQSTQDPLTGGTVTYSNGMVQFTLKGAAPNTLYTAVESETVYIGSSGSYELNTFTTDAMGNATSSAPNNLNPGGDMIDVLPPKNAGFIGGFSVPK